MSEEKVKFFVSINIRNRKGVAVDFINTIISVDNFNGDSETIYNQYRNKVGEEYHVDNSMIQFLSFNKIKPTKPL